MRLVNRILLGVVVLQFGMIMIQFVHIRELSLRVQAEGVPQKSQLHPGAPAREGTLAVELDAALKENLILRRAAETSAEKADEGIVGRVRALKDILNRLPEQRIPELSFATEGDWYTAADLPLENTEDYRVALAQIRGLAEDRFAAVLQPALSAYLDANHGAFPKDASQLMPFFNVPIEPVILQRYKIVPAGELTRVSVGGDWAITQRSVIDSLHDSHSVVGTDGIGSFVGPER